MAGVLRRALWKQASRSTVRVRALVGEVDGREHQIAIPRSLLGPHLRMPAHGQTRAGGNRRYCKNEVRRSCCRFAAVCGYSMNHRRWCPGPPASARSVIRLRDGPSPMTQDLSGAQGSRSFAPRWRRAGAALCSWTISGQGPRRPRSRHLDGCRAWHVRSLISANETAPAPVLRSRTMPLVPGFSRR